MGAAQIAVLGLAALSLALSGWAIARDVPPVWEWALPAPLPEGGPPEFRTILDYTAETGVAHSPAIVMNDDGADILWFAGSREAQADVDIYGVHIDADGTVSDPAPRVTRGALGAAMEPRQLVVTLGNTVEDDAREGGLYATVVSVGGWAMASVASVAMGPDGPRAARKLNLSPILNRSFLVKSPMVAFADGSHGLPAYFEMGAAHGALVRLDAGGRVRDMIRMDGPQKAIQPMIVPLDAHRAVAFLRDFDSDGGRLLITRSDDGGQSWDPITATDIANPSAPVAALGLGGERILMVVNDNARDSGVLNLTLSEDGGATWQDLRALETGGDGDSRYPMMRPLPDGRILLTYSVGAKRGIRAHLFNLAWALGA